MSDLHDVVIFEIATKRVCAIAGRDLKRWDGEGNPRHSVEQRCETVLGTINQACYDVTVVPPGKYNKDDTLTEEDIAEETPDKPHSTDS